MGSNYYRNSRSKYNAKKIEVNGMKFDSKKEYERWNELLLLQRAGKISGLQRQVKFDLIPNQFIDVTEYTPKTHKQKTVKKLVERSISYVADFVYTQDGNKVVEDVKGYRQASAYTVFVIKRKLMLWVHGIRIIEI